MPTSSHGGINILHLLWAAPVAFLVGGFGWSIALWSWCGNDPAGCLGSASFTAQLFFDVVVILSMTGAAVAGILLAAPWTANWTLRRLVAIAGGAAVLVSGLIYMLL